MPSAIERELAAFLRNHHSPNELSQMVLKRLQDDSLKEQDRFALLAFLYNAGYFRLVTKQISELLKHKRALPWSLLVQIFTHPNFRYRRDIGDLFFFGFDQSESEQNFSYQTSQLDQVDPRYLILQSSLREEFSEKQAIEKAQLLERLQFFRNQRLVDEERDVARRLQTLFPNQSDIRQIVFDVEGRWARDYIESRPISKAELIQNLPTTPKPTPAEELAKKIIVDSVTALASQSPELAYDLSLLLYFLDFRREALNVIELSPKSQATDWYKLELLLETRHFVDTLELVQSLELEYANDPDTMFATTYARARAIKELGRPAVAIDLLQSIVNIKPNYRSAQSLLTDWIEE